MPAALPELAAEAAPLLLLLLLLLVLELARGVCCGEHSLTTGNLRRRNTHQTFRPFPRPGRNTARPPFGRPHSKTLYLPASLKELP
jgi:hypothetical protein